MVALAERPCTPCRGGVSPLTPSECASYLAEVPDWELRNEGRNVARRFRFPDYRTALAFTNAVSALAEETWHHPELVLGWGYCEVSLTTRKIGGLHESDFVRLASTRWLRVRWIPPGCPLCPHADEFPEVQSGRSLTFAARGAVKIKG
jgi:4a-hydroxytetrahydrobiopterin dehydratase